MHHPVAQPTPWLALLGSIPGVGPTVMSDQHQLSDAAQSDKHVTPAATASPAEGDAMVPALDALSDRLSDRDLDPVVQAMLAELVAERDRLQERVDELEAEIERTHDIATTASGKSEQNDSRLDDLEDDHEKTRDIAKTAVATAEQANADQQADAERLPERVTPSSSPLDFFANCRERSVKELFVEESNRQNTYRAITVAKRWPEFGTERVDGSEVFFTRDDVSTALTAELGKEPHRQTVRRVWSKLQELGGTDVRVKTRQVSQRQDRREILVMDWETAEGLLDKRYLGLDLLDGESGKSGGVTPVVTGAEGARV